MLVDVFQNFRNKCIEIYKFDPAYFLSAPALTWQACLKKTEIKIKLLTDIPMLLMIEDGIRGAITHAIHRYAEANNKYIKNYDEKKDSSYLAYLDANSLYGWTMSQKLPADGFKWKTDRSTFDKKFVTNYDENSSVGYILEEDAKYPKCLHDLHSDLQF